MSRKIYFVYGKPKMLIHLTICLNHNSVKQYLIEIVGTLTRGVYSGWRLVGPLGLDSGLVGPFMLTCIIFNRR